MYLNQSLQPTLYPYNQFERNAGLKIAQLIAHTQASYFKITRSWWTGDDLRHRVDWNLLAMRSAAQTQQASSHCEAQWQRPLSFNQDTKEPLGIPVFKVDRKAKSSGFVFRRFLKVAVEGAKWTDSGRLLPKGRGRRVKCLCIYNGLDPGNRQYDSLVACWCYGTVSSILLLNTDLAVAPLSLASPGILAL